VTALLVAVAGAAAGLGLVLTVSAWTTAPSPTRRLTARLDREAMTVNAAAAVAGGLVGLVLTGWAVAAGGGAAAGWAVAVAWRARGRGGRREQARVEALASWCEQLRDLLSADHGVLGTVEATVVTCPAPLRPEVARLSTRLARQDPAAAVRELAAEIDDPSGDLVASVLLLAMSRSGRTAELLSELATTIRERAAMRLRVEAERAGQRGEARFVIGFAAAVVAAVLVFGRGTTFLGAYDTATGQAMLAIVAASYGAGMWWLARLTRFQRPARFLSVTEVNR
jgi:Flp pilus assembly protein TadB